MHFKRIAVAAIVLPLLYLYIMFLDRNWFFFLIAIISVIAILEFYSMYKVYGLIKYTGIVSCIFITLAATFYPKEIISAIVISVMAIMIIRLLFKKTPLYSLQDISAPVMGIIYIPCFISFQVQLREISPVWIIFLYATVWSADSLAYYIGKSFGKTKLYREMSPNKTVAGAWGSVSGGILGSLLIKYTLLASISIYNAIVAGIIIGTITIIGDLVESMFKRDAGVKDSGILIPGHGGILDKLDGALFAGPVLYWIVRQIS
ncbi:MAG: phosphatidate cytidylyltransferase [Nitrospirae bacterium]|jgi:phosphatidate cytidylyltransferase|nr:phosphatidate cytidylyltransferase [Nitrospirota bacterium]